MSGTLFHLLLYLMHLNGLNVLLIALYVSFVSRFCIYIYHYVSLCVLYWHMGLFVLVYMYFWSFIHVYFVGTQCGFFPLCVTNFLFVTALLLMLHSVLCVLCNSYLFGMSMCILVPISF